MENFAWFMQFLAFYGKNDAISLSREAEFLVGECFKDSAVITRDVSFRYKCEITLDLTFVFEVLIICSVYRVNDAISSYIILLLSCIFYSFCAL
jgi:hypothetical protein